MNAIVTKKNGDSIEISNIISVERIEGTLNTCIQQGFPHWKKYYFNNAELVDIRVTELGRITL